MRILIINNGRSHPQNLLHLFSHHNCDVLSAREVSIETSVSGYDLVVLNGSNNHPVPYASELLAPLLAFIKVVEVPVIGICYGAELIATAYSGNDVLTDAGEKFRGFVTVSPNYHTGWHFPRSLYAIYEAHRWNVTNLSSEFSILIQNQRGAMLFSHNTKPVIGFLFHPEKYRHDTDGVELLNICLNHLGFPSLS